MSVNKDLAMTNGSKIFCLMTIKNEADIVIDTLERASVWADKIFILDNNSADGTWELIKKYSETNPKVYLWGRYEGPFYLALRQVIFKDFKSHAQPGDWWCRLDGDEFYIDDPREFLATVDENEDHVYNASFQFYYTADDYRRDIGKSTLDHIEKRLLWYKCNHSEIRFIKHSDNLCWPQNTEWPCNIKKPHLKRIRLKHYQYRDVNQITNRMKARNAADSGSSFTHEKGTAEQWYKKRGFALPDNQDFIELRVVNKSELSDSSAFRYIDSELPPIYLFNFKRRLKLLIINFYMKYMNGFLFKI